MVGDVHEVNFKYCETCKHVAEDEFNPESVCSECVAEASRQDSRKPTRWESGRD